MNQAMGCDVIGGPAPAGFDGNIEGHLNVVFDIAERHDARIDIHLHDPGTLGAFEIGRIADHTRALGMEGRVTISHAYCLGDLPLDQVRRVADILAGRASLLSPMLPVQEPFHRRACCVMSRFYDPQRRRVHQVRFF